MVNPDTKIRWTAVEREARRKSVESILKDRVPTFYKASAALLQEDGRLHDDPKRIVWRAYVAWCADGSSTCLLDPTDEALMSIRKHPALIRADLDYLSKTVSPEILTALILSPLHAPCEYTVAEKDQLDFIGRAIDRETQIGPKVFARREIRMRKRFLREVRQNLTTRIDL